MTLPSTAVADDPDGEAVPIPRETLGEFVREQVKLASDIRVMAPDGADIDKWDHIDDATLDAVEWAHGDLHVWFESATTLSRRTARATRHHPAEYAHDDARVLISVTWDLDPASKPQVDIEVVPE